MESIPLVALAAIFFSSLAAGLLIVFTSRWHSRFTGDAEDSGIQKIHVGHTPRIGLVAIVMGLFAGILGFGEYVSTGSEFFARLILCSLPVVVLGLVEDLTKRVSPAARLGAALISGLLLVVVLGLYIPRVGFEPFDTWSSNWLVLVPLTLVAVSGFTNAVNIVDGLNGLAAGLVTLMLGATFVVAQRAGDTQIANLCLVLIAASVGFLVLNFPRGLIFLGDGGAYFLGFLLVGLWIALLQRHSDLVPWFIIVIGFYPVMETVFSMYRRRTFRSRGAMAPDRLHMHSLVYRRWAPSATGSAAWAQNAKASVVLVVINAPLIFAATLWPGMALPNIVLAAGMGALYLAFFGRLVTFRWFSRTSAKPLVEVPRYAGTVNGSED